MEREGEGSFDEQGSGSSLVVSNGSVASCLVVMVYIGSFSSNCVSHDVQFLCFKLLLSNAVFKKTLYIYNYIYIYIIIIIIILYYTQC